MAIPRVNMSFIKQFVQKPVRIVGKVMDEINPTTLRFQTTDNGNIPRLNTTEKMAIPRVNMSFIKQFVQKPVRIVGKVMDEINPTTLRFQTTDNGNLIVDTSDSGNSYQVGSIYEVIGMVVEDGNGSFSLVEYTGTGFNPDFDFNTYNQLVQLIQINPDLFL
eukprot:TRINITY_DN251_c0_g1_i1.p1 TRINITY_DN251_c0_g1~~TRINITY_DN251_c0_g1_i1.p1  ORF type:complete len:179 (+),score=19.76 TRINITY_DN251_c0_g1_i1:52-537(+)